MLNFWFDAAALAAAYGRDVFGSSPETPPPSRPQIVPLSPEERRLDHNLREFLHATPDEIAIAIQQLRNAEGDGDPFIAALRERGAGLGQARRIRDRVRYERSIRPYVPPTDGPLVDMFPELPTARGSQSVFPTDESGRLPSQLEYEREAAQLIEEIRSIDPNYRSSAGQISRLAPSERVVHLDALRLESAALLWSVRQEPEPLQIEMIRLAQRRVDVLYARPENSKIPRLRLDQTWTGTFALSCGKPLLASG
jgi:hypothetical protein